jgi:hypothetical protein
LRLTLAFLLFGSLLVARPALAHDGPPFPLFEERRAGPYLLSLWCDPDIGIGEVYVIVSTPDGKVPDSLRVSVAIAPASGAGRERTYEAKPQGEGASLRFHSEVTFARGEFYVVHARVEGPLGVGEAQERVEATPEAEVGLFGLVLYLFPFVAVGALWTRAALERRARST